MTFDPSTYKDALNLLITPLKTGDEGLRQMSARLRQPMPEGYQWNFGDTGLSTDPKAPSHSCGSAGCAMGLFRLVWPKQVKGISTVAVSRALGRPCYGKSHQAICTILGIGSWKSVYPNIRFSKITSSQVADAIDRYLATGSPVPKE